MLVSRGSVNSVCRPAVASFTSRSPVRARPQLRMRTVSMASPELVSFFSTLSAFLCLRGRAARLHGLSTCCNATEIPCQLCHTCTVALQTKEQKSAIETAIDSAKETCESGSAGACATAWDEVCSLSSQANTLKLHFCSSSVLQIVVPHYSSCSCCTVQVEELSASAADKKQAKSTSDPLDQYCDDNPEADECR